MWAVWEEFDRSERQRCPRQVSGLVGVEQRKTPESWSFLLQPCQWIFNHCNGVITDLVWSARWRLLQLWGHTSGAGRWDRRMSMGFWAWEAHLIPCQFSASPNIAWQVFSLTLFELCRRGRVKLCVWLRVWFEDGGSRIKVGDNCLSFFWHSTEQCGRHRITSRYSIQR